MTVTGLVVGNDAKHHAVAVLVQDEGEERAYKVRTSKQLPIGDEITFDNKKIMLEYSSPERVTLF